MPGNHDKHTSYLMAAFLSMFFEKHKRITVSKVLHPRFYTTYGNNLFVFDHGDDKSLRKFQGNMHKLVLVEAKEQGVDMSKVNNIYFFSGHMHFEMSIDLGGIKHHIIPSLSAPDKWHRENLYVGTRSNGLTSSIRLGRTCCRIFVVGSGVPVKNAHLLGITISRFLKDVLC